MTQRRQADRVLPAAVPPDPRERRVVGRGLHRVDERRARRGRVSPATISRSCPADSASTTCASRETRDAQAAARARRTASTGSATTTTGSTGKRLLERAARAVLAIGRARLPVLHLLGERELDAPLGRPRGRGPDRAGVPRPSDDRALHRRPAARCFAIRATSASTAGRCCWSIGRGISPTPRAIVERWRERARRGGLAGLLPVRGRRASTTRAIRARSASTPRSSSRRTARRVAVTRHASGRARPRVQGHGLRLRERRAPTALARAAAGLPAASAA